MRIASLAAVVGAIAVAAAGAPAQEPTYREPYRPQFHFTPAQNWTNDPNGLVYHEGEYHLFYQHNPFGDTWGHMSWGHAVSRDLVHWTHLPVAVPEEGDELIFSGSAVVDERNTSGFGTPENPPMVAIYTSAYPDDQEQSLAYSTDRGRTWTKYAGNPVLDDPDREFRDPKVFWYEPAGEWRMVVVKAVQRKVAIYGSENLKQWEHLSDFGPANAVGGVWEVPDLFPLPVDGEREKWIMVVSLNPGGVAGGSGTQYFVGDFDGTTFRTDGEQPTRWLDYGKDYYAAVSWSNVPDDRPLMLGWMNNWQYADQIPTSPWRGAMSVPRELALRTVDGQVRLVQQPVRSLEQLRGGPVHRVARRVFEEGVHTLAGRGRTLEIDATLEPRTADEFGLKVRVGAGDETVIGYDADAAELYVDRTRSGDVSFNPNFAGVQRAPLEVGRKVRLRVLVDWSSVEVFAAGGQATITDQVFPRASSDRIQLFARGGSVEVESLTVTPLRSAW